jgi:hypothetical protein
MIKYLLILFSSLSIAQVHLVDSEYFLVNNVFDTYSSYKEKGFYHGHEIGIVSYGKLVKVGVHLFPVLDGGWTRFNGTFGVILEPTYILTNTTFSAGLNLGYINREKYLYPYVGLEFEYIVRYGRTGFGLRSNLDKRTDFQYWGGNPKWRYSGQVLLQHKF